MPSSEDIEKEIATIESTTPENINIAKLSETFGIMSKSTDIQRDNAEKELKEKNLSFLSKMLTIVYDHKVPLFKNGSDDPKSLDNWQIISWYANNEKNKVCKSCEDYLVSPEASSLERTLNLTSK